MSSCILIIYYRFFCRIQRSLLRFLIEVVNREDPVKFQILFKYFFFSLVFLSMVPVFSVNQRYLDLMHFKGKELTRRDLEKLPSISFNGSTVFIHSSNREIPDEEIFIQVVGVNPITRHPCFIQYDEEGNPSYYDVLSKVGSEDYAFPLTYFPKNRERNSRTLYLPKLEEAKIYTSIGRKIVFLVVENEEGEWAILAPNPLNPEDFNHNILWNKAEFFR